MDNTLVVVESPAKARTIKRYLGRGYEVKASMGHIKDLPKERLGVDVEGDFTPEYKVIKGKGKALRALKVVANKSSAIYLALDPDREGEAIAYHVADELNRKGEREVYRVLFNEITRPAIEEAFRHPGKVDVDKVYAQQARRILDRLVGYMISPLLWSSVKRGLSAGRVQSVALRLICEREKEIQAFVSEEYWSITARLEGAVPPTFEARLSRIGSRRVDKDVRIDCEGRASDLLGELRDESFVVEKVTEKERRRRPAPPFITSTLQQEAFRKLRFTASRTMRVAQRLYEGLEVGEDGQVGLITYMRTDSTRVAAGALAEARDFIRAQFGDDYLPASPNTYKVKKGAQEAHEAIRPTSVLRHPDHVKPYLGEDEYQLYALIWRRYLASQMTPAVYDVTAVDIRAGEYGFRASGSVVRFKGFTALYSEGRDDAEGDAAAASVGRDEETVLPPLAVGERLTLHELIPKQHFTQPPPRYTEATLVKDLEEQGIGRPSTYASILDTVHKRDYVRMDKRKFHPTDLGMLVSDLLVQHFPVILDVEFTARMEDELDQVEEGKKSWRAMLEAFYAPFAEDLRKAEVGMREVKRREIPTEVTCEKCGRTMVVRWGRNGYFLGCSDYPECKHTAEMVRDEAGQIRPRPIETTEEVCEKCGSPMVVKSGRYGRFLACSNYPQCKNNKPYTIGVSCPEPGCDGQVAEKRSKRGRTFYGCTRYPACRFVSWAKPVAKSCPRCGSPYLVEGLSQDGELQLTCPRRTCRYQERLEEE